METAIAKTLAQDDGQKKLEGIEKFGSFNEGWQHVVWGSKYSNPKIPINESGSCCGFQCQTCEENPDSKFWCKGLIKVGNMAPIFACNPQKVYQANVRFVLLAARARPDVDCVLSHLAFSVFFLLLLCSHNGAPVATHSCDNMQVVHACRS